MTSSTATPTLAQLRRYAIARSLFKPTTLPLAIRKLGFLQADPIRAPARAQDLILRLRVNGYRAGELERRYARLNLEEDCLVNYGFVERGTLALLHPRVPRKAWDARTEAQAGELLAFVRGRRRATHPKDVLQAFAHHGRMTGYWGNELNVGTQLLDELHYRGLLRVKQRDNGTRVYQAVDHPPQAAGPEARRARAEALLDMVVRLYAPMPSASLGYLATLLRLGAPDLQTEIRQAVQSARERCAHALVHGKTWYWPADENPLARRHRVDGQLRLLAPFDPIAWDRRRFEAFWGWPYKFEAYTPAANRNMGHYALPMLFGEDMVGWANLKVVGGTLQHTLGFAPGRGPEDTGFAAALTAELARMRTFLGLEA